MIESDQLSAPPLLQGRFHINEGVFVPCEIQLGLKVVAPGADEIVAAEVSDDWWVGLASLLPQFDCECYQVDRVLLHPETKAPTISIAVLDDDSETTESLCEWFLASGYLANGFTHSAQLLASGVGRYSAFVVDFLLSADDLAKAAIREIRAVLPKAPILLLTGNLRSGLPGNVEAELAALLRIPNVTLLEKPVRPSVLAATIERALDALSEG